MLDVWDVWLRAFSFGVFLSIIRYTFNLEMFLALALCEFQRLFRLYTLLTNCCIILCAHHQTHPFMVFFPSKSLPFIISLDFFLFFFFIKVMFRRKKKNKEIARFSWIQEWIYLAIGTLFTFFARNYFVIVSHFYSDSWKWCRECETCMLVCIDMWAQQSCNIQNVPINIFAYQSKMAQKKTTNEQNIKRTLKILYTMHKAHTANQTV